MKILITGPESSGKTTLAESIAQKLGFSFVREMARPYLALRGTEYAYDDLYEIALLQRYEEKMHLDKGETTICDTDLLTIIIWSQEKFGRVDQQMIDWWQESKPKHTFLCSPDIPWEYDPFRENQHDRDRLLDIYKCHLLHHHCEYTVIHGTKEHRLQQVIEVLHLL